MKEKKKMTRISEYTTKTFLFNSYSLDYNFKKQITDFSSQIWKKSLPNRPNNPKNLFT